MSESPLALIRAAMPLEVRGIEVNDPVLTIYGENWSLTLMCPWEIESPDDSVSWDSDDIEDKAWNLIGHRIVSVSAASSEALDPVFHLQGDIDLAVHGDTDLDPWTFRAPNVLVVGRRSE